MAGAPLFPWSVLRAFLVGVAIIIPLPIVLRRARARDEKLTWTKAVLLGGWLIAISIVLIGEVPSRILYWFDSTHALISAKLHFMQWQEKQLANNPGYQLLADIVANTVQGIFFVIIAAAAYFWGERHRKEGKFKS
jgi:hypothetical protein